MASSEHQETLPLAAYLTKIQDGPEDGSSQATKVVLSVPSSLLNVEALHALCAELQSLLQGGNQQISEVDLSSIPDTLTTTDLDILCPVITRLLATQTVNRVVLPDKHVHPMTGKCLGVLHDLLKAQLGGSKIHLDGDMSLSSRQLLTFQRSVSKWLLPKTGVGKDIQTTMKVLRQLEEMDLDHLPSCLYSSIVRAYKLVRKKRKVDRAVGQYTVLVGSANSCQINHIDKHGTKGKCDNAKGTLKKVEHSDTSKTDSQISINFNYNHSTNIPQASTSPEVINRMRRNKSFKCYICKTRTCTYGKNVTPEKKQYPCLCQSCAKFNFLKRQQRADLTGKYAVITGGRIKIGYKVALKLLQDGCHVVVTTRFQKNAAQRFSEEKDFGEWKDRLKIYRLDLKDMTGIYRFVEYVKNTLPHLDILINNAAQTIRRPNQFYSHLADQEHMPICQLPATQQALLVKGESTKSLEIGDSDYSVEESNLIQQAANSTMEPPQKKQRLTEACNSPDPESLITRDTHNENSRESTSVSTYFPEAQLDEDGQQVDLRPTNSWRSVLDQVPTTELLEVIMINTVAPFILNQQLKPLLTSSPAGRKFVVNVSAMEGQFNRTGKNKYHPHTNMAKAALNMMTRTAALGWVEEGIYMTAVDTGWVTDERPYPVACGERDRKGFVLPLDCVDGAARVYDPIVQGYTDLSTQPYYGVFIKDYKPYPW